MSKEQFFVRVHTLYNAGGTIWPLEVEFTHTAGEPPTLVERLNGLSKAGFIPANQVAVSPPHTGNEFANSKSKFSSWIALEGTHETLKIKKRIFLSKGSLQD